MARCDSTSDRAAADRVYDPCRLATQTWGVLVVVVVAVGFAAYGTFCISTFTHRRLEPA